MKFKVILAGLALAATSCSGPEASTMEAPAPDHLYWFPAAQDDSPRPWAVILPGGGGIDIFGDEGAAYFGFAEWLNARGIDALVVHYQEDAKPVEEVGMPNYGAEIAGAADRGVAFERSLGRMDERCDGLVFAWSMGGEGLLEMAGRERDALPGLAAAYAYYPSVQGRAEGFAPTVPVTVLQGTADELTPLASFKEFMTSSTNPEMIELHTFEGVKHGFDVTTLKEPVLEGRFEYEAESAKASMELLAAKLAEAGYTCALD